MRSQSTQKEGNNVTPLPPSKSMQRCHHHPAGKAVDDDASTGSYSEAASVATEVVPLSESSPLLITSLSCRLGLTTPALTIIVFATEDLMSLASLTKRLYSLKIPPDAFFVRRSSRHHLALFVLAPPYRHTSTTTHSGKMLGPASVAIRPVGEEQISLREDGKRTIGGRIETETETSPVKRRSDTAQLAGNLTSNTMDQQRTGTPTTATSSTAAARA
ncbi:uncharacterized protein PITG_11483 [Phytophthora infestans T30-4]|uniref:Uncharacterized protein n=1 Tax=Phytophthora infestans (strain T30-4) TaxID=403677 RepID=D0NIV9_PHYIT|nr:uncharacterized protein PITG_11483 [Phytophthora infestans T30-4]EEY59443.1 hypothetical protein PITG_11483 [Phytophthora infestans T30-4]|eukprot:XP_002901053.1 hypothetical protein PITG_11483 [Phytophthora infestans T30-4]